jgi:LEA14-like dessication related protein
MQVRCRVHNPNRLGATIRDLRFEAFLGTHRVGRGSVPGSRQVAARSSFTLTAPVRVAYSALPADLPAQTRGGVLPLRVRASFRATTSLGTFRMHPESVSRVPVGPQIAVLVRSTFASRDTIRARVTRLRVGITVRIQVELSVRNRFPFPLRIRRAAYRVRVGDLPVGGGLLTRPWSLAPGRVVRRRFSLTVPAHIALRAAWKLRGRHAPRIRVRGVVWIDPIAGVERIPFDVLTDAGVLTPTGG